MINFQWLASIETSKRSKQSLLQKWSKTKTCIDLTSKRSKCWVTSQNIQNKAKLQKWSKSNDLHRFDVKTIKTFKTKLNYKSDQNPMTCIDLTSKRSKCWVTSQNIQNKAKLQKWSKSNDLHRFDVKTIKTFKTKLNYKSDQNPMTCIDLTSKRSKCWVTFKTKLNYKSDQNPMSCIDLTSKRSKCWVTSQNIQNKAKLQKWSKSNDLHRFDVKTIKMLSYVAKHSKQS